MLVGSISKIIKHNSHHAMTNICFYCLIFNDFLNVQIWNLNFRTFYRSLLKKINNKEKSMNDSWIRLTILRTMVEQMKSKNLETCESRKIMVNCTANGTYWKNCSWNTFLFKCYSIRMSFRTSESRNTLDSCFAF